MANQTHTVSQRNQMLVWAAVGIAVLGAVIVSAYLAG